MLLEPQENKSKVLIVSSKIQENGVKELTQQLELLLQKTCVPSTHLGWLATICNLAPSNGSDALRASLFILMLPQTDTYVHTEQHE